MKALIILMVIMISFLTIDLKGGELEEAKKRYELKKREFELKKRLHQDWLFKGIYSKKDLERKFKALIKLPPEILEKRYNDFKNGYKKDLKYIKRFSLKDGVKYIKKLNKKNKIYKILLAKAYQRRFEDLDYPDNTYEILKIIKKGDGDNSSKNRDKEEDNDFRSEFFTKDDLKKNGLEKKEDIFDKIDLDID